MLNAMAMAGMSDIKQAIVGMADIAPIQCLEDGEQLNPQAVFGDAVGACLMKQYSVEAIYDSLDISLSFWTDDIFATQVDAWNNPYATVLNVEVEVIND